MAICKLNDMKRALLAGQRLLGLDVGKKTIGLAISDGNLAVASPLKILWRRKFTADAEDMFALCAAEGVGGMIIGCTSMATSSLVATTKSAIMSP